MSTAAGIAVPDLTGTWFTNGFQGTMCELLCAIEEKREPRNSARNNLALWDCALRQFRALTPGTGPAGDYTYLAHLNYLDV